jgi:hypothetical protein
MNRGELLNLKWETAFNSQVQNVADSLRFVGDEQLLEWVEAIMRGETFVCPVVDVPAMERILASMELLRELQRRREVRELEDEATG